MHPWGTTMSSPGHAQCGMLEPSLVPHLHLAPGCMTKQLVNRYEFFPNVVITINNNNNNNHDNNNNNDNDNNNNNNTNSNSNNNNSNSNSNSNNNNKTTTTTTRFWPIVPYPKTYGGYNPMETVLMSRHRPVRIPLTIQFFIINN